MPTLQELLESSGAQNSQFNVPSYQPRQSGSETIELGERKINNPFRQIPRTDFSGLNNTIMQLARIRDRINPKLLYNAQAEVITGSARANSRAFADRARKTGMSQAAQLQFERQKNFDVGQKLGEARRRAIIDSAQAEQTNLGTIATTQLGAAQIQSGERSQDKTTNRDLISIILGGL